MCRHMYCLDNRSWACSRQRESDARVHKCTANIGFRVFWAINVHADYCTIVASRAQLGVQRQDYSDLRSYVYASRMV